MAKKIEPRKQEAKKEGILWWKNIVTGIVIFILVMFLINNNQGYNWAYNTLVKENLSELKKMEKYSIDERREMRLGFDYKFLKYIKDNTPDSAIILFPPDSVIFPSNNQTDFNVKNIAASVLAESWSRSFIYPRMIVYEKERGVLPMVEKATHVAVINYWGYHLNNDSIPHERYAVIPIKK